MPFRALPLRVCEVVDALYHGRGERPREFCGLSKRAGRNSNFARICPVPNPGMCRRIGDESFILRALCERGGGVRGESAAVPLLGGGVAYITSSSEMNSEASACPDQSI